MNPSTQGPTIEQLQKVRKIRRFSAQLLSTQVTVMLESITAIRIVSNVTQGLSVHFSAHSYLSLLLVFPY